MRTHKRDLSRLLSRHNSVRSRGVRRRGSVLLEAAFICTFFLVPVFLGLVQFGVFYNTTNALSQISREAGRLTAVKGHDGNPASTDAANLLPFIREVAAQTSLDPDQIMANLSFSLPRSARVKYQPITVTVSYSLASKSFIPFYKPGVVTRTTTVMIQN